MSEVKLPLKRGDTLIICQAEYRATDGKRKVKISHEVITSVHHDHSPRQKKEQRMDELPGWVDTGQKRWTWQFLKNHWGRMRREQIEGKTTLIGVAKQGEHSEALLSAELEQLGCEAPEMQMLSQHRIAIL